MRTPAAAFAMVLAAGTAAAGPRGPLVSQRPTPLIGKVETFLKKLEATPCEEAMRLLGNRYDFMKLEANVSVSRGALSLRVKSQFLSPRPQSFTYGPSSADIDTLNQTRETVSDLLSDIKGGHAKVYGYMAVMQLVGGNIQPESGMVMLRDNMKTGTCEKVFDIPTPTHQPSVALSMTIPAAPEEPTAETPTR